MSTLGYTHQRMRPAPPVPYDHVYLSPHYDDAALSCGATIHNQTQDGASVLILTVCAAPPEPGQALSTLARDFHSWMGQPEDLIDVRQAEDRASVFALGADVVWLDFHDCIYRGVPDEETWYYPTLRDVFGTVHPEEEHLADAIAEAVEAEVEQADGTLVYAPLGVGDHVDHQIVHRAAWKLYERGWHIAFYEDYPYADDSNEHPLGIKRRTTVQTALAGVTRTRIKRRIVKVSEDDLHHKVVSVFAYGSQLDMLFGSPTRAVEQMRKYLERYDDINLAETFWLPVDNPPRPDVTLPEGATNGQDAASP